MRPVFIAPALLWAYAVAFLTPAVFAGGGLPSEVLKRVQSELSVYVGSVRTIDGASYRFDRVSVSGDGDDLVIRIKTTAVRHQGDKLK